MNNSDDVPIYVIGGYLGAGKTTFINRYLASQQNLAGTWVLVNDFGEVNVDAALIAASNPDQNLVTLTNGCVCCSVSDDLSMQLERLREAQPNRLLIEASGVAQPYKLRQQCSYPGYRCAGVLVLINGNDFQRLSQDKYVGTLVQAQAAEADRVMASQGRLPENLPVPDVTFEAAVEFLAGPNNVMTTTAPEQLTKDFHTEVWHAPAGFSRSQLDAWLSQQSSRVQRIKGVVQIDGIKLLVQWTPQAMTCAPTDMEVTGLVVISAGVHEPPQTA